MNPLDLFYIFLTSLITSLVMVPPISKLAVKIGGMDTPDERKVHCAETPRLGGIAVFCAFLFSVLFFVEINHQIKAFLAGALVIFLTGLVDDLKGLSPREKLIGEVVASGIAVISGGITMTTLGNPLGFGEIQLGVLAIPFTIFAVVGVMNAINLIDGLDGLAGGTSAVACLAFGAFAWKVGNTDLLMLVVALVGSIIGFLRYNTYPARIFMGDSGSLFLGYCMGFFSVLLLKSPGDVISQVAPLMILGVPILDTLAVMGGRKLRGEKISHPDKTHIHHRLLDLGFGHRFSVLIVYGVSYLLALAALLLHGTSDCIQALVLVLFCVIFYSGLYLLSHSEKTQQILFKKNNISLRHTQTFRTLVKYSRLLLVFIKYLLLVMLSLVIFVNPAYSVNFVWGCILLIVCMSGLLICKCKYCEHFLKPLIYLSGLISVFIIANYGRQTELIGFKLIEIFHILFACMLVVIVLKVVLRKRVGSLINSPFEYLILFVVVAVPLLPTELIVKYHLMSVAAKSVIMFVAFKLILIRQTCKNRKVLFATFIAMLALVLRYALKMQF